MRTLLSILRLPFVALGMAFGWVIYFVIDATCDGAALVYWKSKGRSWSEAWKMRAGHW